MGLRDVINNLQEAGVAVKVKDTKEKEGHIVKTETSPILIDPKIEEVVIPVSKEEPKEVPEEVVVKIKKARGASKKAQPSLVYGHLSTIYDWVCENPNLTIDECFEKWKETRIEAKDTSVKDYWRQGMSIIDRLRKLGKLKE